VVWILTGIWHGAAWNFVFWGLGYFVLIAFEKLTGLPDRFKTKFGKVLYRIFSLLFINFQWVMFRAESIRHGLGFIRNMIVYRSMEPANARTLFLLEDYAFFIILAIVLCFPVVPWIRKKLEGKAVAFRAFEVAEYLVILLAFIWSVSFVVAGQNNPFAYANF
jgi:alginate O-acetyltransferase complex protein AlgI